jgi:hypothetical protein
MANRRARMWLALLIGLAVVAAGAVIAVRVFSNDGHQGRVFDSPDEAVLKTCRASEIVHDASPGQARAEIGWQTARQPPGDGWVAVVVADGPGYRVTNCKISRFTHA